MDNTNLDINHFSSEIADKLLHFHDNSSTKFIY